MQIKLIAFFNIITNFVRSLIDALPLILLISFLSIILNYMLPSNWLPMLPPVLMPTL